MKPNKEILKFVELVHVTFPEIKSEHSEPNKHLFNALSELKELIHVPTEPDFSVMETGKTIKDISDDILYCYYDLCEMESTNRLKTLIYIAEIESTVFPSVKNDSMAREDIISDHIETFITNILK